MQWRSLSYPAQIALARIRHRPGAFLLVALGIALGTASLVLVVAGSLLARDRALHEEVARLPSAERAIRVTWGGFPEQVEQEHGTFDRSARRALDPLAGGAVAASVIFREMRIGDALVDVGAADGLGAWIDVRSGRLPRPCRPERCEVIQIGGEGRLPEGVNIVRVGSGTLTSDLPFGGAYREERGTGVVSSALEYHTPTQAPILLAEGVRETTAFPPFESVLRAYAWSKPLEPSSVRLWEVDRFLASVARAATEVEATSDAARLAAPIDQLTTAREASRVGARRLLLIGGEVAALVLAFALLAAGTTSREREAASQRLTWFGARGWQRLAVFGVEAVAAALVGTAVGWLAGAAIASLLARASGAPAWPTLTHSALAPSGILTVVAVAAASAAFLLGTWRAGRGSLGGSRLTMLDVAALGALVAIVVGLVRGDANAQALAAERGTGVFLLLLPGLVTIVAAVACVRLLGPALRALERGSRATAPPVRLAALSLARNPGRTAVAVGFLVVSVGFAAFATSYRSTLTANQEAQASYAVPLDYRLEEGYPELVGPLDAASLETYRALAEDTVALPIVRAFGEVSGVRDKTGTTVLGIPAEGILSLRGWREDFSSLSRRELARRIASPAPVVLRGIELPNDAQELILPFRNSGPGIQVEAAIRTARGGLELVKLGRLFSDTRAVRAALPAAARGGTLAALTFALTSAGTRVHGHVGSTSGFLEEERGTLELGRLRARGPNGTTTLAGYDGWAGVNGIRRLGGSPLRLRYLVGGEVATRFRAVQSTAGRPVPVIASPDVAEAAGPGGVVPIRFVDQQLLVRVVGTATRFPTASDSFVLADQDWLSTALDADVLGSGAPSEVWLGGHTAALADALSSRPYTDLRVTSRQTMLDELRSEPIARGVLITLGAAALVAIALSLGALVLALTTDLRDEGRELRDLEAEGMGPHALRRHLRLRTLIALALGLVGGAVSGAVLTRIVVELVTVTAGTAEPVPPLVLAVGWQTLALGLAGFLTLVLAAVEVLTARAFRSPTARPAEARA